MAQSNESNLLGILSIWRNHTMEPPHPHPWTHWSDQFQFAIIAKEHLDNHNLSGLEVPANQFPILLQAAGKELETERASEEARIKKAMKVYVAAEEKRIKEEMKKIIGLRKSEADNNS